MCFFLGGGGGGGSADFIFMGAGIFSDLGLRKHRGDLAWSFALENQSHEAKTTLTWRGPSLFAQCSLLVLGLCSEALGLKKSARRPQCVGKRDLC